MGTRVACLAILASFACDPATDNRETEAVDARVSADDAGLTLEVADDRYLDELTTDESIQLCTWMVEVQGGPRAIDCGDGVTITIDPVDDCLTQTAWPHCMVGLLRECIEGQIVDLCETAPPACDTFYRCAYGD